MSLANVIEDAQKKWHVLNGELWQLIREYKALERANMTAAKEQKMKEIRKKQRELSASAENLNIMRRSLARS